jgi:hypothetical protein
MRRYRSRGAPPTTRLPIECHGQSDPARWSPVAGNRILDALARGGTLTLLTATRELGISAVVVLAECLAERLRPVTWRWRHATTVTARRASVWALTQPAAASRQWPGPVP